MSNSDRRKSYRIRPKRSNVRAQVFTLDGMPLNVELADVSAEGVAVLVKASEFRPELGSSTQVRIAHDDSDKWAELEAHVRNYKMVSSDTARVGMAFRDADTPSLPRDLRALLNRRRSERIAVDASTRVPVTVFIPRLGIMVEGDLGDVSDGGLSVFLNNEISEDVIEGDLCRIEVDFLNTDAPLVRKTRFIHMKEEGGLKKMGLMFEGPSLEWNVFLRELMVGEVARMRVSA